MGSLRRMSKRLQLFTVFSAVLMAALLISSISHAVPPVKATSSSDAELSVDIETLKPSEKVNLPKAVGLAKPVQAVDIESLSKKVNLHIPEGAVDEETKIEITEHGQWGPSGSGMINVLEFNAFTREDKEGTRTEIKEFNKGLTLSIQHNTDELRGLDLDSLHLYYLDEITEEWIPVQDSSFNKDTGVMTATLSHFSYYGEMANPTISGPG